MYGWVAVLQFDWYYQTKRQIKQRHLISEISSESRSEWTLPWAGQSPIIEQKREENEGERRIREISNQKRRKRGGWRTGNLWEICYCW